MVLDPHAVDCSVGLQTWSSNEGSCNHSKAEAVSFGVAPRPKVGRAATKPPVDATCGEPRTGHDAVTPTGCVPKELRSKGGYAFAFSSGASSQRRRQMSTTWKVCWPSKTTSLSGPRGCLASHKDAVPPSARACASSRPGSPPAAPRNGPSAAKSPPSSGCGGATTRGAARPRATRAAKAWRRAQATRLKAASPTKARAVASVAGGRRPPAAPPAEAEQPSSHQRSAILVASVGSASAPGAGAEDVAPSSAAAKPREAMARPNASATCAQRNTEASTSNEQRLAD
mmetsp:Transcript_167642/g.538428  ORF Transcript_167642/g.538428 Transcript_167642/m.538428 type:complete len:285 (+) Transcript_167642:930-1784(+)